ncbi:MAG TPA: hypothetical protein VER55_15540 [Ardenticatenaceae bacterium]|nr:hypothetical protein [Ardenticatenaceae bacterium]
MAHLEEPDECEVAEHAASDGYRCRLQRSTQLLIVVWRSRAKEIPVVSFVFAPVSGPNTPEWLRLLVVLVDLFLVLLSMGWSWILERRYTSPYALRSATTRQKWRQTLIVIFMRTLFIPLLGLTQPILSPVPDQWPAFPLLCGGIWLILLPLATIYKRWSFERTIHYYREVDERIKARKLEGKIFRPAKGFAWLLTPDQKRFYREGYSGDRRGT